MLTTDKYIDKLQKIGFQKEQAKLVVERMLPLAYLIVDQYSVYRSDRKSGNTNGSVIKPEQISTDIGQIGSNSYKMT